jgi:multimeric flavodoxin WrbA
MTILKHWILSKGGKMKVIGVCCSPRKRGNTETMLREALAIAQGAGADVEFLTVAGKDIKHCDACETCRKTDRCHIEDDMESSLVLLSIFGVYLLKRKP